MKTCTLLLLLLTFAAAEQVSFQVFKDAACTELVKTATLTVGACTTQSYTSPQDGNPRINSFGLFHCTSNSVTWTQWPNSNTCNGNGKALVDTLFSDKCVPIQTNTGVTYQKLFQYIPCTAQHDYTPHSSQGNVGGSGVKVGGFVVSSQVSSDSATQMVARQQAQGVAPRINGNGGMQKAGFGSPMGGFGAPQIMPRLQSSSQGQQIMFPPGSKGGMQMGGFRTPPKNSQTLPTNPFRFDQMDKTQQPPFLNAVSQQRQSTFAQPSQFGQFGQFGQKGAAQFGKMGAAQFGKMGAAQFGQDPSRFQSPFQSSSQPSFQSPVQRPVINTVTPKIPETPKSRPAAILPTPEIPKTPKTPTAQSPFQSAVGSAGSSQLGGVQPGASQMGMMAGFGQQMGGFGQNGAAPFVVGGVQTGFSQQNGAPSGQQMSSTRG